MPSTPKGWYVNLQTPSGVQRWRFAFRKLRDQWGCTDWGARTVWLHPGQPPATLADTIIHEVGHVTTGFRSEPTIELALNRLSAGATAALLKAGLMMEGE